MLSAYGKCFFLLFMATGCGVYGGEPDPYSGGLVSAVGTAISRADVALARSIISPIAFKGSLGENVVANSFIKDTMLRTGNWHAITPRSGPQGLDHVFIKVNSSGAPTNLMIGESKFGSSQLGFTKDGIQMGDKWISPRLHGLGTRYVTVSSTANISTAAMPLAPKQQLSVVLKNGEQVNFWRRSSLDKWNFSGSKAQLPEAQKLAGSYGAFFQRAGNDSFSYKTRIFNITANGNDLNISVYDTKNIDKAGSVTRLNKVSNIKVPEVLNKNGSLPYGTREDISKALKSKLNLSDSEARKLATRVTKNYTSKELMEQFSLQKTLLMNAGVASAFAMGLDSIIQLTFTGNVDMRKTGLTGGSVLAGVYGGQGISMALISTNVGQNAVRNLSGKLYCPASVISGSMASLGGGLITTALISYGGYFCGFSDLSAANRQMIVGTAALGVGTLVAGGTMATIAAFGTAGTGTAIATLGGAAATNASLACLGGGTLAAGGGGVALGTTILTGGTVLVIFAAGYGLTKLYEWNDCRQENNKVSDIIAAYSKPDNMQKIIDNRMKSMTVPLSY